MEFSEAFARLQSDPKLAEKFVEDPEGVLTIMGVDTSNLVFQRTVGGKEPFKAVQELRRSGADLRPLGLTICGSIGYIVCGSVGGDTAMALREQVVAPPRTE